ncbi:LysR family transcriptional regulator [Hyphomicrobium sp.]|uniref:LysR family transcriptional regulator n=1 Tax=Hyphomicrobium sp. TaxID=82 RepID=UPI003F70AD44
MQELARADFDGIEAFVAVAELGGFAAAAKKIERDASVVSRRVSQLEARLGVRLLVRTTRRVALTEAGEAYLKRLQAVLEELSAANLEVRDMAAAPQGLLRVSAPSTFGRLWLAPLIAGFLEQHALIRVDLRFSDRMVDLLAEGFDLAVRVGVLPSSSLQSRKIGGHRMLLAAAPAYLKRRGTPKTPDDLAHHDCIGFTGNASWPDWRLQFGARRKTVRPPCRYVTDNSEAALAAGIGGAGVILAPDWLAGPALHDGSLREILRGWTVKGDGGIYTVLPTGRLIPKKSRAFIDYLAAKLKVTGDWKRTP